MHWLIHPYTISLFAASAISLVLAVFSWKTPTTIKTRSFTVLMVTVFLWAAMHIFELAAATIGAKVFWANINVDLYYEDEQVLRQAVVDKRQRAGKKALAFEISEDLPTNWPQSIPVVLDTLRELE